MRLIGTGERYGRAYQTGHTIRGRSGVSTPRVQGAAASSVLSSQTRQNVCLWMWIGLLILAAQALVLPSASGQTNREKASTPSIVEVQGTVSSVELTRGSGEGVAQRGCLLHVKTEEGGVIPVRLGPMRYLMEHSFSPRTGDEIRIRGYRLSSNEESDEVIALSADLPGRNQELKLRDERGRPLWSGHRGLHGRGRGGR